MTPLGLLAVGAGAALGAWLRWAFSLAWNALNPSLPYGTLAANLLGGYLIGIAVGMFGDHVELSPEWKLLVMTGFLGGLTTFSTFSAEVLANVSAGNYAAAALHISVHVLGSCLLVAAGLWTYRLLA
ncbi:MAG TPA: fluoride efflux transporter CrcB [Burkholderiaceae bacterium]|nr:fluoride efflux transporter CrcB [Burkholderiaceae bacterium]